MGDKKKGPHRLSLGSSTSTTKSSTNALLLKKTISDGSIGHLSQERAQEVIKLESNFRSLLPRSEGKSLSDGPNCEQLTVKSQAQPLHPRQSRRSSVNPSVELDTAIKNALQPYTKTPQTSLEEIGKKVSEIYEIVGKAVDNVLQSVVVQQTASAAKQTGLRVAEHPISVTIKFINEETTEENLAASCTSSPTISPPSTADSKSRPDSVKTNESAPHSASSQRSIQSSISNERPCSGMTTDDSVSHNASSQNSERPDTSDSVETNNSPPYSASSQRISQSQDSGRGDLCIGSTIITKSNEDTPAKKPLSVMDPQEAGYICADETNFEVICGCQLSPLIHNNKLYVPVQSSTSGNDMLKSYNLVDGEQSSQEVKKSISYAACKMFYLKNISLLVKSSNATKLGLYQLDTKTSPASWKIISRHSVPLLDVKNSIPIPYKDDGIIVVSILNQPSTSHIKFHIFSQSIAAEKPKSASSQIRYNANYQIQSCSILSNYIYCALSLPEGNIYIYKLDIASLRKETHDDENISPNCQWSIKISKLQNCFVSVFKGEIFYHFNL